eukprot:6204229-Amphidinium_carterae.1
MAHHCRCEYSDSWLGHDHQERLEARDTWLLWISEQRQGTSETALHRSPFLHQGLIVKAAMIDGHYKHVDYTKEFAPAVGPSTRHTLAVSQT